MLTVLQAHPGLGQSSLARALGFDKVTVLRVLRGLQARGLVTRCPAETNRRNMVVALTAAGEDVLAQAQKPAEKAYKRLMAPLDKDQQEQLLHLLQLLTGELEDEARAAFDQAIALANTPAEAAHLQEQIDRLAAALRPRVPHYQSGTGHAWKRNSTGSPSTAPRPRTR